MRMAKNMGVFFDKNKAIRFELWSENEFTAQVGLGKFRVKKGPIPCYFLANSVLSLPFCGFCSVKIFSAKILQIL